MRFKQKKNKNYLRWKINYNIYTWLTFKNASIEVYLKYYSILWQFLLNYECLQEELTTLFVASHFLSA